MAELIGDSGEVAVIVHDQTSRTGIDRRDGFLNEMKEKHPNIKIVSVQYGGGDHLKSAEIAKAIIQANPNLKGIFGANEGSAEGAAIGVKESGKKLVLIGYDSGKEQKDAIRVRPDGRRDHPEPDRHRQMRRRLGGEGAEGREAAEGDRHRLLLVRQDQHRRSEDRRGALRLRGWRPGSPGRVVVASAKRSDPVFPLGAQGRDPAANEMGGREAALLASGERRTRKRLD